MESVRVTWEDAAAASRLQSDSDDSVPPGLAPASDCSSSTYQSELSHAKLSTDASLELQKDDELNEWVSENANNDSRRHVVFKEVEIRCYPIIPGVHPECAVGPPVSAILVDRSR